MRTRQALANPSFRRLWIAQGISIFGDYVAMFAVQTAIVFRMHGSGRAVSGMLMASLAPGVMLGPFAGVFADRWNPRRVMVASDILRAALVVLLAFSRGLPHIYVICFALSSVSAFFGPAQAVVIPLVVQPGELLGAGALMQQTLQVARMASPAVAGALVAHFGESACYAADSASFLFSAAMLAAVRVTGDSGAQCKRAAPNVFRELREGVRHLFAAPELRFAVLSMAGGTFAASCYSALAALYVRDLLHAGSGVYGAVGSLTAIGTFAGAALTNGTTFGSIVRKKERKALIAAGMGVVGAGIVLLAAVPAVGVAMLGSFAIGTGAGIALVAASAALKERTPAEFRGRVSSVSTTLLSAAQAAAILLAGACAARWGMRAIYALSGAMLLAQPAYQYFRRGIIRSGLSACSQTHR